MIYSELLNQIRKQGYTIEEAAKKLCVSRKTLYNYASKFDIGELSDQVVYDIVTHLGLNKEIPENYKSYSALQESLLLMFEQAKKNKTAICLIKLAAEQCNHYELACKLLELQKTLE
jgi:type III secretion system FlhB-like substrate exporter